MNFIETLTTLGGVKPCPYCHAVVGLYEIRGVSPDCRMCHGTDQILNLAPLLASPKELEKCVLYMQHAGGAFHEWVKEAIHAKNLHVVGPARASNLIYEVTRQLGGTAVVTECAIETILITADDGLVAPEDESIVEFNDTYSGDMCMRELYRHRLSLPIPPDATVLFVTDKFDEKEMRLIRACVSNPIRWLSYVLALVSATDTLTGPRGQEEMRVIALHQENL